MKKELLDLDFKKSSREKYRKTKDFFETKSLFLAYIILAIVFLGTISAFVLNDYNNLFTWDHGGHLDSANFILENTWPSPTGWNPHYFNGYPQNTFYPPLVSWIIATLGLVIPIAIAYKLFLALIYLSAPFVFYRFARLFWKKREALQLNLLLILTFFIPDWIYYGVEVGIGGTLSSTFGVGLVSAYLGFLFIVIFIEQYEKNRNNFKLGIIFALGLLAHYVFAIVLIYMIINIFLDKNWKKFIITLISGTGISAFWWIPFIFYKEYLQSANFVIPLVNITSLFVFTGVLILATKKLTPKRVLEKKLFFIAAILFFIAIIGEKIPIQGQLYRVFFLICFLTTPLIFSALKESNLNKIKKIFTFDGNELLNILPILITILILILSLNVEFTTQTFIDFTTPIEKTDNIHIIIGPNNRAESHHIIFYEYINQTGNRVMRGLFSEQSPNIIFNSGLYLFINPNEFVWGTIAVRGDVIQKENFNYLLDHFGVQSIITTEPINEDINFLKARYLGEQFVKVYSEKLLWFNLGEAYEKRRIIEYYFSEPDMVEVIDHDPVYQISEKSWDEISSVYLASNQKILTKEPMQEYELNPDANITNLSRTNESISFTIDSNVAVPVLIKESYFPRWNAYVNGEPTKIYIAAPYLMAIVGKGDVELKYEASFIDQASLILSILFFLIVILKWKLKKD